MYYEKTVQNGHYTETCAECFFSKKHYSAGSTIIAVRTVVDGTQDTLKSNSGQAPNWLVAKHPVKGRRPSGQHKSGYGQLREALCKSGAVVSEVRYSTFPFQGASRSFQDASRGEMRYLNGETVTDLLYTGQKLEEELGLYYYVARWYDPYLNRFLSPDSIIPDPGSTGAYDRYAYVENNPLNYTDPTGHKKVPGGPGGVIIVYDGDNDVSDPTRYFYNMHFYDSVGGSRCTEEEVKDVTLNLLSIAFDPVDYYLTYEDIKENGFHWYHGFALAPIVPLGISKIAGKHLDDVVVVAKRSLEDFIKLDGVKLPVDEALDIAIEFIGENYEDMGNCRFLSIDGTRQVRMADADLLGHHGDGPHINLDIVTPKPNSSSRKNNIPIHILFE